MFQEYNKKLHVFDENTQGRDFVLGDIHGCYTLLMDRLREVSFDFEKDRAFCVGDLIDRGPENELCLNLIYQPWFFPVIGNHELLFYEAMSEPYLDRTMGNWVMNGGNWVFETEMTFEDLHLFSKEIDTLVPLAIKINKKDKSVGIVHAEPLDDWDEVEKLCKTNYSISKFLAIKGENITYEQAKQFMTLTWSRKRIKANMEHHVSNIDEVYVGHTILKEPKTLGNVHYIDTGAFKNKNITILEI